MSSYVSVLSRTSVILAIVSQFCPVGLASANENDQIQPRAISQFIEQHCFECHQGSDAEAGFDLQSLQFDLSQPNVFDRWVLVHDRIRSGEMPPPEDAPRSILPIGRSVHWDSKSESLKPTSDPYVTQAKQVLHQLAIELAAFDQQRIKLHGRAKARRLNRFEYENKLRELLQAPWLHIAHGLPEDGIGHLFNKIGERLDVAHVQMTQYLSTARRALRLAANTAAHPTETRKFYAREEPTMHNYLHYRFGQQAATRSIVPLLGFTPEPDIIRKLQPVTVGDTDPAKREQEAMGVFSGVYSATTKYDFSRINTPINGNFRIRFKTYTFMAGPNGADKGDDHGLTGGDRAWWRPDRNVAFAGQRSEPVTLYALSPGGDSRWLTTFDAKPEPSVFECIVALRSGEGIRPDAARLVRTRPGWSGNPNASKDGVPGFAMNWLEVEGPLYDKWPPPSYQALFGDLPFEIDEQRQVRSIPREPAADANRLLSAFYARAIKNGASQSSVEPFIDIFDRASELGEDFTDALLSSMSAILCAPSFLYFDAKPGALSGYDFNQRLAYFLWNGPANLQQSTVSADSRAPQIRQAVEKMLKDARSDRFINAFLDYWLDLRNINANTPDSELYPDYYLDELLTESSVLETRRFFRELIDRDLPARNLVDSDFVFVNERLAQHYGFSEFEGVRLRRVDVPADSPRGGLLTQASVLRVTANGTTTSPVIRGAWIMERIMGVDIPSPPSGVAAVEPDIRGAKTIREQLAKHRSIDSCNACHSRFDPAGFALESFDVAGGWRDRYRSVGEQGVAVTGFGKNGHAFQFKLAQIVDCGGTLANSQSFRDIKDLKRLLLADQRQIARNLVKQLVVYATGAPIGFSDRAEIEQILDRCERSEYGIRSLVHQIVLSDLFALK